MSSNRRQGSGRRPSSTRRTTPPRKRGSKRPSRSTPTRSRARSASASSRRRPDSRRASRSRRRVLPQALTRGQRPFLFAFVGVLVVLASMAAAPVQRYLEMQDRVNGLQQQREDLSDEVDELEQRREELEDPDEIELIARRDLGLVEPGEVPYVVVREDDDVPDLDEEPDSDADRGDAPWWRRLGEALGLLGDGDDGDTGD